MTKFHKYNLGIRNAIPLAVDWVLKSHDNVIVIEEDAVPDQSFYEFFSMALRTFENDQSIINISAYSCVPSCQVAKNTNARLTKYPDSYAWATWSDRWKLYDDELPAFNRIKDIKILWNNTHGLIDFLSWRRELKNARAELVNTWAYRWLYTAWKSNKLSINSNVSLIEYIGQNEGTNVNLTQKWTEMPTGTFSSKNILLDENFKKSDLWKSKNVYRNTFFRLIEIYLITFFLKAKKSLSRI